MLVIILLVFLYYVIKESDFLESENFQKVIDTIQNCSDKYIKKKYIILLYEYIRLYKTIKTKYTIKEEFKKCNIFLFIIIYKLFTIWNNAL